MKVTTIAYSNAGGHARHIPSTYDNQPSEVGIEARFDDVTNTDGEGFNYPSFGGDYSLPQPTPFLPMEHVKMAALIAANLHEFVELVRFDGGPTGLTQHDARDDDQARRELHRILDLAVAAFKRYSCEGLNCMEYDGTPDGSRGRGAF